MLNTKEQMFPAEFGHTTKGFGGSPRTTLAVWMSCVILFLLLRTGFSNEDNAEKIEEARAALNKWVEVQRAISRERRDLKLAKEMLRERIDLMKQEIKVQRDKIADAEASLGEAQKKQTEMEQERDTHNTAAETLETNLVRLEERMRELLKRLPEPIKDRVKPLSQGLPDANGKTSTTATVAERFQNVVGILLESDRFNGDLTMTSEYRDLPDGSKAEVSTVYLGVGQAYYVNADGRIAGVGRPGTEGWIWEVRPELAPQISQIISILKNEIAAAFVQAPVTLQPQDEEQ